MKVFVVITGMYETTGVGGVYSSPERAMAAHPVPAREHHGQSRPGGWQQGRNGEWNNGLYWGSAAYIEEYEVDA